MCLATNSIRRKQEIHIGEGPQTATVVCELAPTKRCCLGANQKVDYDGGIHQNHGRVVLNNSAPEILPSQVPERDRIWRWAALSDSPFFRTKMAPSPRSVHRMTVPGPMPACSRISWGIVLVPLLVTTVSHFIPNESY